LIGVLSFERGILSRLLSVKCLVLLGKISFSIYLVHQVLLRWYLLHRGMFTSIPKALLYIGYWLVVLGISFMIWGVIEKPSQRWLRSRLSWKRDPLPGRVSAPSFIDS
jgi:peptidoglycan/LPS O-acetylase OafA/YrhL